ncbi:hypothetical protein [Vulcanisaeta distributa]|uniref:Glycosyl transferase group 1 n=1 Tax=Vulcanisaeta distributa (strain DSM 14429 / JCM 11212 / NBRC 100878 / IC-017) TaxID=572478 RepID=E1QUE4_VULDI|nr:hypothetical protein [Vulcanisaeta distributa]ADN49870.1 hypothetical protein Vdis_0470 [Vulcanisaeta distributa DSM 14429]
MKTIAVIGALDLYTRHELGLIATLNYHGYHTYAIALNPFIRDIRKNSMWVEIDRGHSKVNIIEIPLNYGSSSLIKALSCCINELDIIILTSGIPWKQSISIYNYIKRSIGALLITRFWSIRALKLIDNLLHGSYYDLALFMPSLFVNYVKMISSNAIIYEDHYTYKVGKYIAPHIPGSKIYPTPGIPKDTINEVDEKAYEIINNIINKYGGYVLASTILIKAFDIEKYEAVPHALLIYGIARRNPEIPIIVFGSTKDEFQRAFPELARRLPQNLVFIGKGLSNKFIRYLYRNASVVIIYISNRSVSNRFLETIYFRKPMIFNRTALELYPELVKFIDLNLSLADNLDDYTNKIKILFKNDKIQEELSKQIGNAYEMLFSSTGNIRALERFIENSR